MASAESANTSLSIGPNIAEAIGRLTARQRVLGMVGIALLIALIVGSVLWTREPSYAVLFSNLSEKDGGQIVTTLQQQNVPYKINEAGTAIMVPGTMVHDIRLRLASQGIPKGGLVGFELMENQKLGISQFSEQINYQRGLEGELARSVQSLAAIRAARVHLAIPKQTAFLRDEQKPSASVLVSLHAGRVLEPSQVAGIVHLVSSSVPQLNPANVSVIDQDGNLISQQKDPTKEISLDPSQLKYVHEMEARYIQRIESILGTVVGNGNVRAQVAADIDFSLTELVAETYKPNPTPETAIRSQQTAETGTGTPNAVGVPGALSNQPPVPATAPITSPAVAGAGNTKGAATEPNNYSKNATTNYEVDKTVRHTKATPGGVRRLSVAIVINHKQDAKGKAAPRSEIEMKQINDLAREAMGFNKDRGDTLNVANAPFSPQVKEEITAAPLWQNPGAISIAKDLGKYALIALLGFMLWKRLLKPLFERLTAPPPKPESTNPLGGFGEEDSDGNVQISPQAGYESRLAVARSIAKDDPKVVAGIIREWVNGSEPQ